jgi:deoxyhypusine synthase
MNTDPIVSLGLTLEGASINTDNSIVEARAFTVDPKVTSQPHIPSVSATAVLGESTTLPADTPICKGHDFNKTNDIDSILQSFLTTGFQATNIGLAIQQIQQLRAWRLSDTPWNDGDDDALRPPTTRSRIRARIFLAYTSNQISCGQREIVKYLVQHKMVDVLVTTAGGVEEDLIKCMQPTFLGDFQYSGRELRKRGINRIGNLLVPNKNYCEFEDWLSPLLTVLHDEQDAADATWAMKMAKRQEGNVEVPERFVWTPSKMIKRLGKEIDNDESVYYWAGM